MLQTLSNESLHLNRYGPLTAADVEPGGGHRARDLAVASAGQPKAQ
jgi:hypothetical protein